MKNPNLRTEVQSAASAILNNAGNPHSAAEVSKMVQALCAQRDAHKNGCAEYRLLDQEVLKWMVFLYACRSYHELVRDMKKQGAEVMIVIPLGTGQVH